MTRTPRPNPARTARFELHETGGNDVLLLGPRHLPPLTDDLVLAVQHRTYGDSARRSILMSRAQTGELLAWLGAWWENGWPGVPRTEGPTSTDVIEHYRAIAVRERLRADHERLDTHRLLHAAIALAPPGARSAHLDAIALEQGRVWVRLQRERDRLEEIRRGLVNGLCELQAATSATADELRAAAGRLLRLNKPGSGEVDDTDAAETPLYDRQRLITAADLLPSTADSAVKASATGGEQQP
ncbi:hypothetical protein OHA21_38315 [Actinoplanes sp. NBC_00393]|uniref:hypothetical protein n=1 Tax=Actinoplanes sp. NBC_00393 TaxID=2975953 RepID=UPI002E22CDF9